jgi:hypothetical protein
LERVTDLVRGNRYDEADALLRDAVDRYPDDPDVRIRWEAFACAKRAQDCMDEDFPLLTNLVNLAGRIASVKNQPELAEKALRFAFDIEPEFPWHAVLDVGLRHSPEDPKLLRLRDELRSSAP